MFLSQVIILQALGVLGAQALRSSIVNGTKAERGQFPYQISLKHRREHICGGSIITTKVVLTAMHCCRDKTLTNYMVVAGIKNLAERGVVHQVARIILAENITDFFKFDLAILKVVKPFVFNNLVAPIALDRDGTEENSTCFISGWGLTSANATVSQELLFAEVKTMSNAECHRSLPYGISIINKGHICTSTLEWKGTCQGDSGGPLACNNKLTGITSFGKPCAVGVPDVFVRVSVFIKYIEFYLDQD